MKRLFKIGADRHDRGRLLASWQPHGVVIATVGKNGLIHITDRHGGIMDEISLSSSATVLALQWDCDGENLAILQENNPVVSIWGLTSRRVFSLDTNLKDPSFIAWSKVGPQLAIGSGKGNLLIYNQSSKRKVSVLGKHGKKITCGIWSEFGNRLVLGSEDSSISVNDENGDNICSIELKHPPIDVLLVTSGNTNINKDICSDEDLVAACMSSKTLVICDAWNDKEEPMELSFAKYESKDSTSKYGDIRHHERLDDKTLIVGFSLGYLVSIPISGKSMGQELNSGKFFSSSLTTFAYNPHTNVIALAGDDGVRMVDGRDFMESRVDYISTADMEDGKVTSLSWTSDGQILTVATSAGNVYNFLAKMSVINATHQSNVAYLSSLREISVLDVEHKSVEIHVPLKLEPSFIALGSRHVAAGMNNRVYFHSLALVQQISANRKSKGTLGELVNEKEYVGTIRNVQLNNRYAVVLTESQAFMHIIDPKEFSSSQGSVQNPDCITFPEQREGPRSKITCVAMTNEFLYFGTEAGTVELFCISDWTILAGSQLRLDNGIKKIFPNVTGTRAVIVDNQNLIYLYNPVTGGGLNYSTIQFDLTPQVIKNIMWDVHERNVIMIFDGKYVHTYVYVQNTMSGSHLVKLGPLAISLDGSIVMEPNRIEMITGNQPIASSQGMITCQTMAGNIVSMIHPYFDKLNANIGSPSRSSSEKVSNDGDSDVDSNLMRFCQALGLGKLDKAFQSAYYLNRREIWLALGGKAVEALKVELAIRVYRQLGDAGMVLSLQNLVHIEDRLLLSGHIAMLFNDYDRAQELFLLSSAPTSALQMRRDLLQWEHALNLAKALASPELADICVYFGQHLENRSEVDAALKLFESSLSDQKIGGKVLPCCVGDMRLLAQCGLTRCHLRLGNIRQGIKIAYEVDQAQLYEDCGDILENQKQFNEAAEMHLKAEKFERAAFIYTKHLVRTDKNKITEAAKILEKVKNDQLNTAFAKFCFTAGKYHESMEAYARAKDVDKVVELKLRHLDQIQEAFDLVRSGPTENSAQLVAEYCAEISNVKGSIEFLLLANKNDEAFRLAQSHSLMDAYTELLGDHIFPEDALKVAHYFEKTQNYGRAGRFYLLCNQYPRALKLFIQCGDKEIDAAIDVVGKSQSDTLTHQLIDFLIGETDGVPKDSNYIYKLYIALKRYEEAAKTAMIIANQEQEIGNYQCAHQVLFEVSQYLQNAHIKVPLVLLQKFVLLHSYILVKSVVRSGNHSGAARLLQRVVQNISKFPQHYVPILTSAVIECQRANMKLSCYEYAVMLMKPEHRANIDPNIRKKIEAIVRRKTSQTEEADDFTSKCPVCTSGHLIPDYQLECPVTRDTLPMCVVTGRHMVLDDWTICPNSKLPAIHSEYLKYILSQTQPISTSGEPGSPETAETTTQSTTSVDPVLGKPVSISDLKKWSVTEASKYIKRCNNEVDEGDTKSNDEKALATDGKNTQDKPLNCTTEQIYEGDPFSSKNTANAKRGPASPNKLTMQRYRSKKGGLGNKR